MNKKLKIGILGGIGPYASAIFYERLIIAIQESGLVKSNHDYPQIFINSIPALEIFFGTETDDDLLEYIEGLKLLDSLNPDYILMVCNTVHLYLPYLQKQISAPILNLVDLVNKKIETMNIERLVLLGSKSSMNKHLYDLGVKYVEVNQNDQRSIVKIIDSINLGKNIDYQKKGLDEMVTKYLSVGADVALMGCTELDAVCDKRRDIISPMDILIEQVLISIKESR